MAPDTMIESLEPRRLLAAQLAGWSGVIDNPYFPLVVGSSYVYTGIKDGSGSAYLGYRFSPQHGVFARVEGYRADTAG